MIFINVSPKCDHCDESLFSEEELNAHIEIVHKNPTRGVVAGHCLELKSVESEKEKDLSYPHCFIMMEKIPVANTVTVAKTLLNLCKVSKL